MRTRPQTDSLLRWRKLALANADAVRRCQALLPQLEALDGLRSVHLQPNERLLRVHYALETICLADIQQWLEGNGVRLWLPHMYAPIRAAVHRVEAAERAKLAAAAARSPKSAAEPKSTALTRWSEVVRDRRKRTTLPGERADDLADTPGPGPLFQSWQEQHRRLPKSHTAGSPHDRREIDTS